MPSEIFLEVKSFSETETKSFSEAKTKTFSEAEKAFERRDKSRAKPPFPGKKGTTEAVDGIKILAFGWIFPLYGAKYPQKLLGRFQFGVNPFVADIHNAVLFLFETLVEDGFLQTLFVEIDAEAEVRHHTFARRHQGKN